MVGIFAGSTTYAQTYTQVLHTNGTTNGGEWDDMRVGLAEIRRREHEKAREEKVREERGAFALLKERHVDNSN